MNVTAAHDIIEKLAFGIDPDSGAPLDDSVFQNAMVIRALFMAKGALATASDARPKGAQGPTRKHPKSANAGKKWEAVDKATLRELHLAGVPIREIALQLGRSHGSIVNR